MTRPAERAAGWLADGLAAQVESWSLGLGADPTVARQVAALARDLMAALDEGHVCLPLPAGDTLMQDLLASRVVGTPQAPGAMPLIVDGAHRLYLHRSFDQERRLAQHLRRLARVWHPAAPTPEMRARLDALFGPGADGQKRAVALALRQGLVLVSGGPGTGKTTTVAALLACLLAETPALRIALAAPTGKAAARLAESLRERAGALPEAVRDRLPRQASTVHRLLGAHAGGFTHDARNPLPIDLLVVDEASMLDLALAARLLDAVPDTARVVLLGDKDQLAAVEAGAVFAEAGADPGLTDACREWLAAACGVAPQALANAMPELADTPPAPPGALHDAVIWLDRNFRFGAGSAIGRAADAVRRSAADEVLGALRDGGDAALQWLDDGGKRPDRRTLAAIDDGFAPYIATVRRDPGDVAAVAAAFERFRVLCAVRDGPRGVHAINRHVAESARRQLASVPAAGDPTFVGRPVMVLRNDPLLRLFNGDIGFVLPGDDGAPAVWFPAPDGGFRAVAPQRLPEHDTAFATTVHKAQGSEFDAVLVLLPEAPNRLLGREWLYTAITRARRRVVVAGGAEAVELAVQSRTLRHSGLVDRLRECVDA